MYERAEQLILTNERNMCTVHALYRYTLMQFARQMTLVNPDHSHPVCELDIPSRVGAIRCDSNFTLVADAINSCGNLNYEGVNYRPNMRKAIKNQVTYEEMEIDEHEPTYDGASSPLPGPSDPNKRPALTVRRLPVNRRYPNPYLVNIAELRDIVQLLANPGTPEAWRAAFIERNPIPGADYVNGILMNPDAIMPLNFGPYLQRQWMVDQGLVDNYFRLINVHAPHVLGKLNLDGKGSETMLTTVKSPPMAITCDGFVNTPLASMYAVRPMSDLSRWRGYVSLMNEPSGLPHCEEFNEGEAFRSVFLACHVIHEPWFRLVCDVSPFNTH
jgi:hypothetical protein